MNIAVRYKEEIMTVSKEIKQTLGFDPNDPDLQKLLVDATPPLGIEYCSDLFKRCGHTLGGITEGWQWNPQIMVTDAEAWQMIAISALYWQKKYEQWYEQAQKQVREQEGEKKIIEI